MKIDPNEASKLLNDLWDEVYLLDTRPELWDDVPQTSVGESAIASHHPGQMATAIDHVLTSKTKTYKYIMLTQLLGKAVDDRVNILAMQASSKLPNAWAPRKLCEAVITRGGFEKDVLQGVLGSSRQPYNSTPGQYTELSKSNHARSSDLPMRDEMIDALLAVNTSEQAKQAIRYFLYVCKQQIRLMESNEPLPELTGISMSCCHAREFLRELGKLGRVGEGLSIAIATLLSMVLDSQTYSTVLYQINTSRQGHGDIDVYLGASDKFLQIEVKDKPFSADEVEEYALDARGNGWPRFMFVYGEHAGHVGPLPSERLQNMSALDERNFMASCVSFDALLDSSLFILEDFDLGLLSARVVGYLEDSNAKPETLTPVRNLLRGLRDSLA